MRGSVGSPLGTFSIGLCLFLSLFTRHLSLFLMTSDFGPRASDLSFWFIFSPAPVDNRYGVVCHVGSWSSALPAPSPPPFFCFCHPPPSRAIVLSTFLLVTHHSSLSFDRESWVVRISAFGLCLFLATRPSPLSSRLSCSSLVTRHLSLPLCLAIGRRRWPTFPPGREFCRATWRG